MATVSQNAKSSSGDRAIARPIRYWPIVVVAVVLAESAHAPLIGRAIADALNKSPVAKMVQDPKPAPPPRGVQDKKDFKPLAFEDKNPRPEKRKPDLGHNTPLVSDSPPASPNDPSTLATPVPSPDITDGPVTNGAVDTAPVLNEQIIFPAYDPSPEINFNPTAPVTQRPVILESPVSPVPEPGSAMMLIVGFLFSCRRRR